MDELNWMHLKPGEMRSLVRTCRSVYNRTLWRRAMQRRCSAMAAAVRSVRSELGGRIIREQRDSEDARTFVGLDSAGNEVVLARIRRPPAKTLADIRQPIAIEMLASDPRTAAHSGDNP